MKIRTAIAQTNIAWRDVNHNKENAIKFFEEASENKAELIVFPEMTFMGFSFDAVSACEYSDELIGFVSDCSKKYKINSIFGFAALSENGLPRNMCAAVSADGEIIARYAKIHAMTFSPEERDYTGGNSLTSFTLNGIRFSMLICFDLRFPELFQAVSEEAGIITVIANWPSKRLPHWELLLRARAVENQCYILGANRVGSAKEIVYSGGSSVIAPCGEVLCARYNKETLLVCDVDMEDVTDYRKKFPLKNCRRNDIYQNFYK